MSRKKLLIVDDDQLIGWALEKGIGREDFQISVVETGRDALREVEQGRYHMVLLDIHLPDANGLELLEEIRRRSPDSRVVITSADATESNKEKAASGGANRFLEKPFTISAIQELLSSEFGDHPGKRKHERYACNIPLSVVLLNTCPGDSPHASGPFRGNALDVGKAGIRLAVDRLLSVGQKLHLLNAMEDNMFSRFVPPRASAEVVWVSPDGSGCTAGLRFA